MKKTIKIISIILTIMLLFTIIGCKESTNEDNDTTTKEETIADKENINYVLFTLNVHDWVNPEMSIEAVEKTIEIHEKYNIPVDIYLNDPTFQNYLESAPELLEQLKTSEVVVVSYHFRPPTPMYSGFDYLGLDEMDEEELYETLLGYTEHKLDLETGEYIEDEEGDYQLMKDTFGYAPICLGIATPIPKVSNVLKSLYAEKGASFVVVHNREIELGEKQGDLFIRPEQIELKWYEYNNRYMAGLVSSAEEVLREEMLEFKEKGKVFINIKMHENNYYTEGTAFWPTYWTDSDKSQALEPPYNLSASEIVPIRDQEYTDSMWEWYEEAVKYVANNEKIFTSIDCNDLKDMVEEV